ncbi:MAG: LptF/LptG family permease, partial [Bacillati bacterium ANGP1]
GDIEEVNRTDPAQFNRTFYRTNRMRVSGVGNIFTQTEHDTYKSDREMSTCEMRLAATAARRDASRAAGDARLVMENDLRRLAGLAPVVAPPVPYVPDTAPPGLYCRALRRLAAWLLPPEAEAQTPQATPPLPPPARTPGTQLYVTPGAGVGEAQRLRDARTRAATYEVEIQKKYAIAAACLVFALVGVPVALRFQRGGVGLVIGMSVAVFAVYYFGLIVGEDLGDRLVVSPFLAMWTPNLIFAAAGVFGLWRIRKPGNAPNGGDWSDVGEAVRRVVSWPVSLLRPAWRSLP